MIYTVGDLESYRKGLKQVIEGHPFKKMGPYPAKGIYPLYGGGIAFKHSNEAGDYIEKDGNKYYYGVFSLNGIWDVDTYLFKPCQWRITRDLVIIKEIKHERIGYGV